MNGDPILVVASLNGGPGMDTAMAVLRAGGSAIDAVEAATRIVEANTNDHSVGVGGFPNALGEVELDASLMEGTTRRVGAVAALKGYPHPISVARAILDRMPQHSVLADAGAARFAAECGFETAPTLTDEAAEAWRRHRAADTNGNASASFIAHEAISAALEEDLAGQVQRGAERDPLKAAGTVNFLARDQSGKIATAVSTAGWAFKYPGRVGDSPVIGAGNYCDDRFGACACTGIGEWSIRAGIARQVILRLELGQSLHEACAAAMADLEYVPLPEWLTPMMNFFAFDARTGEHLGVSQTPGTLYVWQRASMSAYETTETTILK